MVGRARAAVAEVAATGTDPDALVAVLGWLVRPRCSPDALRRRCAQRETELDLAPRTALREAAGAPPDDALSALPGLVTPWRDAGVRLALVGDPAYPPRLAHGWPQTDGPPLIAIRGAHPADAPAVAIVGTRRASGYGSGVAAWLAEAVAGAGAVVISGGAVGVDTAAHGAAVEQPGGTTVVLGCGHAVSYPRQHARPGGLFDQIVDHGGGLLSELLPFQRPNAGAVRARNRIVAALADVVVVVEGGARSGALITAGAAAERGVPVLAVPGDVRAPGSVAPHRLLAEGAAPCRDPGDVLAAIEPDATSPDGASGVMREQPDGGSRVPSATYDPDAATAATSRARSSVSALPGEVHERLELAWPRPLPLEDLATASGVPAPRLLAALTRARIAGEVAESTDGVRLRRAP